jgi:peptidoglycan/LPS O-acetylase OafA/YrhL
MTKVTGRRVPELDGIRGVAILLVVFWHYVAAPGAGLPPDTLRGLLFRAGILTWSGVDLFFVLSGFLIGGILLDAKGKPGYFRRFYGRRTFRILPLYVVVCLGGAALVLKYPDLAGVWGQPMPLYLYATFTQNFWAARHSLDVFMGLTWSLAVEEQFYLTLPFVIRYVRRDRLPWVIGAMATTSALARTVLYLHFGNDFGKAASTLVFFRADALMAGVLGALAVRDPTIRAHLVGVPWILNLLALTSGAGVTLLLLKGWTTQTRPMSTLGYSWLACFYLALILIATLRPEGWWPRILRSPILRWLGSIAYCLYLVHELAFRTSRFLLTRLLGGPVSDWAICALGLTLALGLSELSWVYFESKIIAFGHLLLDEGIVPRPVPSRGRPQYPGPR